MNIAAICATASTAQCPRYSVTPVTVRRLGGADPQPSHAKAPELWLLPSAFDVLPQLISRGHCPARTRGRGRRPGTPGSTHGARAGASRPLADGKTEVAHVLLVPAAVLAQHHVARQRLQLRPRRRNIGIERRPEHRDLRLAAEPRPFCRILRRQAEHHLAHLDLQLRQRDAVVVQFRVLEHETSRTLLAELAGRPPLATLSAASTSHMANGVDGRGGQAEVGTRGLGDQQGDCARFDLLGGCHDARKSPSQLPHRLGF